MKCYKWSYLVYIQVRFDYNQKGDSLNFIKKTNSYVLTPETIQLFELLTLVIDANNQFDFKLI